MKITLRFLTAVLCLGGIALSAVSLHNHYAASPTEYCDLGQLFNCDLVNRSVYSRFLGVPVALIGTAGYVLLLGLTLSRKRWAQMARLTASTLGLGFSVYLTYIEARVLAVWCMLCIGSLLAIAGITLLASMELWRLPRAVPVSPTVEIPPARRSGTSRGWGLEE